jgi:hypothetical protein
MDIFWFESARASLGDIAISFHSFHKLLKLNDVFHKFRSAETGLRLNYWRYIVVSSQADPRPCGY